MHKYLPYRLSHDNQMLNVGPKVPQAHTRHHHHLRLAESVWSACLEAADVPYALTYRHGARVLLLDLRYRRVAALQHRYRQPPRERSIIVSIAN